MLRAHLAGPWTPEFRVVGQPQGARRDQAHPDDEAPAPALRRPLGLELTYISRGPLPYRFLFSVSLIPQTIQSYHSIPSKTHPTAAH